MKLTFSLILIISLLSGTYALAHGPETETVVNAPTGILPDNFLFFIDRFFEKIGDAVTVAASSKAKRLLAHAQERLAEYSALVEREKFPHAQKALSLYAQHVQRASDLLHKVKKDKETEAGVLANKLMIHQEVLAKIYTEVPETAQKGILTAIEASQKSYEKALEHLSENQRKEVGEVKKLYDREIKALLAPPREIINPPAPPFIE